MSESFGESEATLGRAVDVVIWCTGFKPALDHLRPLGVVSETGRVELRDTRWVKEPRLWLLGYGDWTGFASATLIGVGRSARSTAAEIADALKGETQSGSCGYNFAFERVTSRRRRAAGFTIFLEDTVAHIIW